MNASSGASDASVAAARCCLQHRVCVCVRYLKVDKALQATTVGLC